MYDLRGLFRVAAIAFAEKRAICGLQGREGNVVCCVRAGTSVGGVDIFVCSFIQMVGAHCGCDLCGGHRRMARVLEVVQRAVAGADSGSD